MSERPRRLCGSCGARVQYCVRIVDIFFECFDCAFGGNQNSIANYKRYICRVVAAWPSPAPVIEMRVPRG